MAKENKKAAPSLEDRLDAALVADWEQPYKIPENWCWTKLDSVAQWGSGGTPSRRNPEYFDGYIPWVKTGELNDNYIYETEETLTEEGLKYSSVKLYPINTIVIAMYGATIGKVGILGVEATTNQACACGVCSSAINYRYLFYYARSQKENFIDSARGGAQPNISQEIIRNHPIPIPPLAEQQRIVDRIESLFAKLDEAKEKAQAVVDGFEDRKAAILHKAFTGELTAEWRKANGILSDDEAVTIESICSSLKYGTAKKSESSGEVVVIRMGNLQQGEIDWTSLVYSNDVDDNQKYRLKPGDVLFNRTNSPELVGKTAIYRGEYPAIFAGYLIKLDYDHNRVIGEYLNYILNSPEARAYCNKVKSDGVNQSNINAKKIGAFSFRLPLIEEQQEIVSIIKTILDNDMNAKDNALQVIDHIDSMKKSILSRAFRGELGTNDPKDESAIELLKAILVEANANKSEHKPVKKKVSVPVEIDGKLDTAMERDVIKLFYKADTTAIPIRQIMSISSKKFELMEVLRSLEKKKILKKNDDGSYTLIKQV